MILDLIREAGGWAWVVAGLALLALELVVAGVFALWIGLAALAVGVITLLEPLAGWDWRAQAITFVALSVVSVLVGRRMMSEANDAETGLNRPARDLVGRTGKLIDPIEHGSGRARVGDTLWRVEGPDLPVGAPVRVTGERNGALSVEPVGAGSVTPAG